MSAGGLCEGFVRAVWPAPENVIAFTTTRCGGVSVPPFDSFNLADHVGDDVASVARNRDRLMASCALPAEPLWLRQVHGDRVIDAARWSPGVTADGSVTQSRGVVCAVMTADCLPLFLCDRQGTAVGLLHVGWRGLVAGIVERGIAAMAVRPSQLMAWMGPAIGFDAFEIGSEVKDRLQVPGSSECFRPSPRTGRWLANLYQLVHLSLVRLGVTQCAWDPQLCTFSQPARFFSHRRDGVCGRMASLVWIDDRP